ncbi:MAG: DUF4398 domain-containing protein [Rubrivivax sp.]|nr:DUF4398 domain-containing protein [Rubrivivax sp.]
MRKSSRLLMGCGLFVVLASSGCSYKIPEAEMKAAQEAMEQARNLHAEELASSNWKDAVEAWEEAQAAVKEEKPAKSLFLRARSRFEKAAKIARASGEDVKKEVGEIQIGISERLSKVKAALEKGGLSSKTRKEVSVMAAEADDAAGSIEGLLSQGELIKARNLAKETQRKIYNAELILAGKKPAS